MDEIISHAKLSYSSYSRDLPVNKLFLLKYGRFPRRISITPASNENGANVAFHVKSVLERVYGNCDIKNEFSIIRRYFHPCSKQYYACEQLLSLPNIHGVLINLNRCSWVTNYTNNSKKLIQPDYIPDRHFLVVFEIFIFYLEEHESFIQKFAYDLIHDDTLSLLEPKIANLRLIGKYRDRCNSDSKSFYLMGYTYIKKPRIDDLALSYGGQDFLNVHRKILTWLNKKDANGLVLLHGAPGSGKTHYIRYLLHCITNEKERYLIYVPSDMINYLTSPALIPLLLRYPNSLLIIEDAEGSLSRLRSSSQSVANLLNLSDGLLSDGIQVQILATFNCSLVSLDSALLRSGRLIVQHCFPSILDIENARRLADSIGVSKINEINEPLSLANIYAMRDENVVEEQNEPITSSCRKCIALNYNEGEEE
ncbi:unnamed protein product [Rotaria sp. Silwood1]|nr:unnamed protein product [Rotaria sp. Silwood1]CAF1003633.1 unnamed protein product [Rotaria sp. Silwood1]CAF3734611.1 unnamed protein product [Rotaria sp. Silwood1]CAF4849395.1 unnamed protein product [Rotaria sp. Silwood1]